MIGAQIVLGLQTLVARRVDPLDSAVLSTCQFHAGTATNVIPDEATLSGTLRTLKSDTRDAMERLMRELVLGTAAANGAEAEFTFERGYPSVVNDPAAVERAAMAGAKLLGADKVIHERLPGMGGEDFAYMAQKVPGCFVRIGQADGEKGTKPVHTVHYDFNDDILPIGASLWATLVEQELPRR